MEESRGLQGNGRPIFGSSPENPVEKPLNHYLGLPLVVRSGADMFRCPADRGGGLVPTTHSQYYGTSYATNLILIGDFGWIDTWDPYGIDKIEWHRRPCSHNVAFLDGHAEFLTIRHGSYTTPDYNVLPFHELIPDAYAMPG